jgi:hypothetical protein
MFFVANTQLQPHSTTYEMRHLGYLRLPINTWAEVSKGNGRREA